MRGFKSKIRRVTVVALAASLIFGCPDKSHRDRQGAGKPALELRKAVSFALATPALPGTRDELVAAISDGMRGHVKLADDHEPVVAEGDGYPSMRRLAVDLTDAQ